MNNVAREWPLQLEMARYVELAFSRNGQASLYILHEVS